MKKNGHQGKLLEKSRQTIGKFHNTEAVDSGIKMHIYKLVEVPLLNIHRKRIHKPKLIS